MSNKFSKLLDGESPVGRLTETFHYIQMDNKPALQGLDIFKYLTTSHHPCLERVRKERMEARKERLRKRKLILAGMKAK